MGDRLEPEPLTDAKLDKLLAAAGEIATEVYWGRHRAVEEAKLKTQEYIGWVRKWFNSADLGYAERRMEQLSKYEVDANNQWAVTKADAKRIMFIEREYLLDQVAKVIEEHSKDKAEGRKLAALIRVLAKPYSEQ